MVYNTARGIFGKAVRYERRCRGDEAVSRERWSGLLAEQIIELVYQAAQGKMGHDPIYQIVGYIISGDPTYLPATITPAL